MIIDQAVKYYVSHFMALGRSLEVIPNLLYFTYIRNTGAAFGIFPNRLPVLTVISILFIAVIIHYYTVSSKKDPLMMFSLSFMLGGAVGNLIDRIFRGYVVDVIDVKYFSVFNFADIMINAGVVLLLIDVLIKYLKRER